MLRRLRAEKGQSMLEAIIATGIIVTAVSSALTLVSGSIKAEKESEALLAAGNLAREGVEAVRAIRDSNWLAGRPWDSGLTGTGFANRDYDGAPTFNPATNDWAVDFSANAATDDAARIFRYATGSGNAVVGLHVQAAAQPAGAVVTPYRRFLTMALVCEDGSGGYDVVPTGADCGAGTVAGREVSSVVTWRTGGGDKRVTMTERLFNWR